MKKEITDKISELAAKGAIFYISHSGGKDSQCMFIEVSRLVPADQVVVIHSHLPGVVWKDTRKHLKATIGDATYIEVQAGKTFMEMVDHRQMFPSPKYRQCTSDLKRDPINKAIRHDLKARGKLLAVSCIGLRAEESCGRARKKTFKLNARLSKAGREVYEMLPIHDYLEGEVFGTIKAAGQKPHWCYKEGSSRCGCCFCIMATKSDMQVAARCNPEMYREYVEKEKEIGFTMKQGASLEEITGITIN
jgi:3'-phosphoadenosine 5'-phosphosulfate sulfotransferase (PAPS reductase)/FAD synthetase